MNALPESRLALVFASLLIAPLALAGLALLNAGLVRARNAAHLLMCALSVIAVSAGAYFFCGFSLQGFIGGPAHIWTIGGKEWNWVASLPLFWRGVEWNGSPAAFVIWSQLLSVALTALIPLGAAAERWRLGSACISAALLSGFIYPLFAHWIWGGGWLAQLGVNYGLGAGFVDAGGSSAIQALGGLSALAMVWLLGPRHGKYSPDGMPMAIPGHNAVLVLSGCMLAWIGWLGLNSAGALLYSGVNAARVVLIVVNTTLGAVAAAAATAVLTRARFGKPDASLTANGFVAGLAAGSGACAFVPPAAAIIIGLVAGVLVPLAIENLELRLGIDDPGGAISVHGLGGLWGVIAVGFFGRFSQGESGQWIAQLIGVATLLGGVLPFTYGANWLLNRFLPYRIGPDGERQGLDLHELGAGAYPEFMTHTDEFLQR